MYEKDYQQYSDRSNEQVGEEAYVEVQDQEEVQKKKIRKEGPIVEPESVQGEDK